MTLPCTVSPTEHVRAAHLRVQNSEPQLLCADDLLGPPCRLKAEVELVEGGSPGVGQSWRLVGTEQAPLSIRLNPLRAGMVQMSGSDGLGLGHQPGNGFRLWAVGQMGQRGGDGRGLLVRVRGSGLPA